jgi:hypothetical protein
VGKEVIMFHARLWCGAKMHPVLCGSILDGGCQEGNGTTFAHQIGGGEQMWCYIEHFKDVSQNVQCHCKAYLHLRCNCCACPEVMTNE